MDRSEDWQALFDRIAFARKEIAGLVDSLKAFDATGMQIVFTWEDRFPVRATLHDSRTIDRTWPITVSNVVHQLRSALDNAIAQLVVANGGTLEIARGQFPIFTSLDNYRKDRDKSRYLEHVAEPARRVIDALQPFNSSTPEMHPLAILNRISNWDKHRGLHAATHVARDIAAIFKSDALSTIEVSPGSVRRWPPGNGRVTDGDDLLTAVPDVMMTKIHARFRGLLARDPEAVAIFEFRIGVGFGGASGATPIFSYQLQEMLEFVASKVIRVLHQFA